MLDDVDNDECIVSLSMAKSACRLYHLPFLSARSMIERRLP